jgi:hypothetical protein
LPAGASLACGALGNYERDRVHRIAELLGCEGAFEHEDDSSALILDREPLRWGGDRQHGFGWIEADARQPSTALTDWQTASGAGVCGLALDDRRRLLHSAVNGLAPLYWLEQEGAVYFASRIDPLARTSPSRLSIDWDAWAAIIALRYPLGTRTPFAEIRRLPPSSTLRHRSGWGRAKVERQRWPWTEVEPDRTVAAGTEAMVAALEETLAPLPGGIVCPLSGGRDSRMLFMPLARDGRVAAAATVPDDEGDTHEEDLAQPVAAAFGVPQERLRGAVDGYPAEWEERARRVEYEFVDHAWMVPLARRLAGTTAPVPDGFAIDAFGSAGRHFYSPETLDTGDPRAAMRALFETVRRYGHAHLALEQSYQAPLVERAREQFLAGARHFDGHPNQALLAFYSSRSLRGVSTYSTKLLGDRSWVVTPGATDPFARAALSIPAQAKTKGVIYRAIFEILDPTLAALPSTADVPRKDPHLPQRWCSPTGLELHRRSLRDGPLAPHLSTELLAWIAGPTGAEPDRHLRLGIEAVSLLHAWWRRYRDCLREVDPTALRG